ncbi:MATE family efflux transporter [Sunxiuqinia sp. A32]|uniref:MATE family efflux transporter n=1 Tax=Sunxiuqinia sp. A32 TaxID=3461496 RepID=UPI00404619F2
MEAAKRVAMNTGILYARMAITVFISLYITRLILAALGAKDYGIYNVILGSIAMLTFLNAAMVTTTQRFMSHAQGEGNESKLKNIFNVSTVLHIVIGFVILFVLEVAGYFLFKGILEIPENRLNIAKILFQLMLVSTFFTIISVPYDAIVNAHENMLWVAIIGIIEAVLKLAVALYITITSFDKLLTYGILMVIIPIFLFVLNKVYCYRKYEEAHLNIRKYFDRLLFKRMTGFASLALLNSAASIVTMQGISIILNSFFGVIVNAAQGVSHEITGKLMAFSQTMLKALNPVIVKSEGGNDRVKMLKASMTGNKISFFLLAFLAIPVIIEMPYIMDVWLKDVPEYAVVFCRLNLFRLILNQLTVTFPTAIEATGNIRYYSYWNSLAYILVLPVSFFAFKFGAPPYTIYLCLVFMVLGLFLIRIYFVYTICGLSLNDFFLNVVGRCMITSTLSMLFASIPLFVFNPGIIRLVFVFVMSMVSFLIFLFLVGFQRNEKQLFVSISKSIFRKIGI